MAAGHKPHSQTRLHGIVRPPALPAAHRRLSIYTTSTRTHTSKSAPTGQPEPLLCERRDFTMRRHNHSHHRQQKPARILVRPAGPTLHQPPRQAGRLHQQRKEDNDKGNSQTHLIYNSSQRAMLRAPHNETPCAKQPLSHPFSNKASLQPKQGFFTLQTRLLCDVKALFANGVKMRTFPRHNPPLPQPTPKRHTKTVRTQRRLADEKAYLIEFE